MNLAKPLLLLTLLLLVFVKVQAQVGEKFYGRASYYADKFHGRTTSSGEIYDRAEYTAAHRDLPFNTIVEIINTTNNRTAVVKINDRGPFAYNRMIDLSFVAAKDLELLGPGEAEVQMRILSMDRSEYTIPTFYAGAKGEFNREFNQYESVSITGKNIVRVQLDTTAIAQIPMPRSVQPKPVTESFVIADSLRKRQEEGDKMGFRQHKYIRVIKDADGRYRLDSSIVTPPTAQEAYSVAPQNTKVYSPDKHITITPVEPAKSVRETTVNDTQKVMKTVADEVQTDNHVSGFRQYQYVKVYTDSEGRIRMDTTHKAPVALAKNVEKKVEIVQDKAKVYNTAQTHNPQIADVLTVSKSEHNQPKEVFKNGFRQHAYIKVYRDKDGKMKVDSTSYEKP
jgi:rare lipoprotein A (peptidoglycan hydrolase)